MAIEPHKHCPVCGTAIPLDETTCSAECDKAIILRQKQSRKSRMLLFAVLILFIAVWAYMTFLR